ncbi:uncharacterized protein B0H18DRAFT_1069689 [Fomitopsis serialis]|uniref:uncharacterized protein n=1 Tax=Fomitopsis serialis TaxID=139415 RepID=UPI002008CD66|nr:uncharacterized protein B0H18DRAFT_1069689 [Neoantrodia serialis]KAH9910435.1 hypothetical protein B0H18DRAFT_1069689 [Neoantrodia serialis]
MSTDDLYDLQRQEDSLKHSPNATLPLYHGGLITRPKYGRRADINIPPGHTMDTAFSSGAAAKAVNSWSENNVLSRLMSPVIQAASQNRVVTNIDPLGNTSARLPDGVTSGDPERVATPMRCCWGTCDANIEDATCRGVIRHLREAHIQDITGENIQCRCGPCISIMDGPSRMGIHVAAIHLHLTVKICPFCGEFFGMLSPMERHIVKVHSGRRE